MACADWLPERILARAGAREVRIAAVSRGDIPCRAGMRHAPRSPADVRLAQGALG